MKTKPNASQLNADRLRTSKVLAEMTSKVMAPKLDNEQLIVNRANEVAKSCFQSFRHMYNLKVVPMTKDEAKGHITKLYKDKYLAWSKDDLLDLLSLTMAVLAVESLHDELI